MCIWILVCLSSQCHVYFWPRKVSDVKLTIDPIIPVALEQWLPGWHAACPVMCCCSFSNILVFLFAYLLRTSAHASRWHFIVVYTIVGTFYLFNMLLSLVFMAVQTGGELIYFLCFPSNNKSHSLKCVQDCKRNPIFCKCYPCQSEIFVKFVEKSCRSYWSLYFVICLVTLCELKMTL
jgi:hypothetical protein